MIVKIRKIDVRVAIDLTALADNFSGIERYALNIALGLIDKDKEDRNIYILLFKNSISHEFLKYKGRNNVVFKIINGHNKLIFNQLILPLQLYSIKADKYIFLAFQSPWIFRRKGIYNTIHDLTCWDCPETMKRVMVLYYRMSVRNALKISEKIITISEFSKKRIIEKFRYDSRGVILAYCGISDVFEKFMQNDANDGWDGHYEVVRKKYYLPDRYLLCLATLEPRKNLPFLVESYLELLQENSIDIPLVLAGRKGWKVETFLETIESKYRDHIIVTGFIDDEDLPYIYKMAECFVFPSIYEGFGMPPLEALYVGTRVIASDIEVLREVLGNEAEYFDIGDKEGLKKAVGNIISNGKNSSGIHQIKERCERFKWEDAVQNILAVICGDN